MAVALSLDDRHRPQWIVPADQLCARPGSRSMVSADIGWSHDDRISAAGHLGLLDTPLAQELLTARTPGAPGVRVARRHAAAHPDLVPLERPVVG